MKELIYIMLLAAVSTVGYTQELVVEPEEQNKTFVKAFKHVELNDVFDLGEERLLGIYEDKDARGGQKAIVYRLMRPNLKQIKSRVQELPDGYYLRYTHQFKNGKIMAILFEDLKRSSDVNLYLTTIDVDGMKADLKNKVLLGKFTLSGSNKRATIRSGNLFTVVQQKGSEHVAIINNQEAKRGQHATKGYTIIDNNLQVVNQGIYDFKVKNKDLVIKEYTISDMGHLYCSYRTYIDDNRAGDNSYVVQMDTKKKVILDKGSNYLNNPSLVAQDGEVFLFSTYGEARKDKIKGRSQGIFLATVDEATLDLKNSTFQAYSQELLETYFHRRKSKAKKGELKTRMILKFLRHVGDGKFAFLMEDRLVQYIRDQVTGVTQIIYYSNDAICGIIDQKNSKFDWINIVPKFETTKNVDRVGSFAYMNSDDELCVIFNSTRKKEKKDGQDFYINRNLKKTSIMQLRFDHNGQPHEEALADKDERKDIGFIFDSRRAFQDEQSQKVYLVLTKRLKNLLRIATIE